MLGSLAGLQPKTVLTSRHYIIAAMPFKCGIASSGAYFSKDFSIVVLPFHFWERLISNILIRDVSAN